MAVGANSPLTGVWKGPVAHVHGNNGIGGVALSPTAQLPISENAVDFMLSMVREHGEDLTIITLGHLTNLALALQREKNLPKLVKRVIIMGGTVHAPGNVTAVAEANIYGDPEAADQVFVVGVGLTMVGLDVTLKTCLHMGDIELLCKYAAVENQPIANYIKAALTYYMGYCRSQSLYLDHCPVHAPLALLVAVDPGLVSLRRMKARVECGGTYCRGMVVTDLREKPFDAKYVNICEEIDGVRAVEKLLAAFC